MDNTHSPKIMLSKVALFIMPRSSRSWEGSEALWITVGGWAAAAQLKFGKAYVLTTDCLASPKEILDYPLGETDSKSTNGKSKYPFIPQFLITLIKDILLWRSFHDKSNFSYTIPDVSEGVSMIWEQHDLFSGSGRKIADKYKVPLIKYVHAPQVWESKKWGVQRPIWGKWLEWIEAKNLKKANLVACVSQEVAEKLIKMGVSPHKVMVSPMAVDPSLFEPKPESQELKELIGIKDKFVIGWTGSFRSFHGLDLLVDAFELAYNKNKVIHLLLVGDGLERPKIEKLVQDKGLTQAVTFIGRKKFKEIPAYVSIFDIAIVSARNAKGFHYSPLKLREYMAAGKATLAPNAGEIPVVFRNDEHLILYNVGDIGDMAEKIFLLSTNLEKRNIIAQNGKSYILKLGTWDVELNKALIKLKQINYEKIDSSA